MLHAISNQELEHLLTLDHPTWSTYTSIPTCSIMLTTMGSRSAGGQT